MTIAHGVVGGDLEREGVMLSEGAMQQFEDWQILGRRLNQVAPRIGRPHIPRRLAQLADFPAVGLLILAE